MRVTAIAFLLTFIPGLAFSYEVGTYGFPDDPDGVQSRDGLCVESEMAQSAIEQGGFESVLTLKQNVGTEQMRVYRDTDSYMTVVVWSDGLWCVTGSYDEILLTQESAAAEAAKEEVDSDHARVKEITTSEIAAFGEICSNFVVKKFSEMGLYDPLASAGVLNPVFVNFKEDKYVFEVDAYGKTSMCVVDRSGENIFIPTADKLRYWAQ